MKHLIGITPRERVALHLIKQPSGCLEWEGCCSDYGYPQVNIDGRIVYVHKQVWEWANGPVPKGWEVDHTCRNRRCGNLDHLEAVPKRINGLRGNSPPAQHARKQACPNGHSYDAIARYRSGKQRRYCRQCESARRRKRYQEQRCA